MIARAPGKLFTTGAYAILEGAPAIVVAVNRYAQATLEGEPSLRPEVIEVARRLSVRPPHVDVNALERDGRKLGLGSSAAAAVASAMLLVRDRQRAFEEALQAHRAIQPRGSGADVAAAAHGGVIRVRLCGDQLEVLPTALPVAMRAFALDRAVRTSDALDRLATRRDGAARALSMLVAAAEEGAAASTVTTFVAAAWHHVEGLAALGAALDLPLVPPEVDRARDVLFSGGSMRSPAEIALLPSGAGGGDTVLWLGARAPTEQEAATLDGLGLHLLDLEIDTQGAHVLERS